MITVMLHTSKLPFPTLVHLILHVAPSSPVGSLITINHLETDTAAKQKQ